MYNNTIDIIDDFLEIFNKHNDEIEDICGEKISLKLLKHTVKLLKNMLKDEVSINDIKKNVIHNLNVYRKIFKKILDENKKCNKTNVNKIIDCLNKIIKKIENT